MSVAAFHQLNPPLPLETPLGHAQAHFIIWPTDEDYFIYGCFQDATGENWWWRNTQVRMHTNITGGRPTVSPIGQVAGLEPHLKRHGQPQYTKARK